MSDWVIFNKKDVVLRKQNCGGHLTIFDLENKEWLYLDTMEPVRQNPRSCKRCGNPSTEEGHDACLGKLPGIQAACCGHGVDVSYIVWKDGVACFWDKDGTPLREIMINEDHVFGPSYILVRENQKLENFVTEFLKKYPDLKDEIILNIINRLMG